MKSYTPMRHLSMAGSIVIGLVFVPAARAAEPATRAGAATSQASRVRPRSPGTPVPAPAELLSRYIEAVKQTPEYRRARELDPATVRASAAQWEKELGVKIRLI